MALRLLLYIFFLQACNGPIEEENFCSDIVLDMQSVCGIIDVPLHHEDHEKGYIGLAYVILKCIGSECDTRPVVFLQGGPGGSAISLLPYWQNSAIRQDRDIILVDQRGTGNSTASCSSMGNIYFRILSEDLTLEEETEKIIEEMAICKREMKDRGISLDAFSSVTSVRDLELLRKKLGYKAWSLLGSSYGSRLALTYMRENPAVIHSVILQGPFPVEDNLYDNLLTNFKNSLEFVFSRCEENPNCSRNYPNFRSDYWSLIDQLNKEPITLESGFILNAQDLLLISHLMLYQKNTARRIPEMVEQLKRGSAELQVELNILRNTLNTINGPVYWSIMSYEELPFSGSKEIRDDLKRNPKLTPGLALFMGDPEVLQSWHNHRADEYESLPVRSDIPALILAGEFDPITPSANARKLIQNLEKSQSIVFLNEGHAILNPCFDEISANFLRYPERSVDGACASKQTSFIWP